METAYDDTCELRCIALLYTTVHSPSIFTFVTIKTRAVNFKTLADVMCPTLQNMLSITSDLD